MEEAIVKAPARLHLGFLDLNFGLGRKFGSLGLALNRPSTKMRLARAETLQVSGPESERVRRHLETLCAHYGRRPAFRATVERAIPAHMGFGSGTQLALAAGAAFVALEKLPLGARDVARILDRGNRSGIGVGVFDGGGVVLDGGRGSDGALPPVIARLPFPPEWRVLLIFDTSMTGRSGEAETSAFKALPPAPASTAGDMCRLVVMRALPGLVEKNIVDFGGAVTELQRRMGDYFAPYQAAGRFTSTGVAKVLAWLEAHDVHGTGQTSWGPTGFAFLPSSESAMDVLEAAKRRFFDAPELRFLICTGRNTGAKIQIERANREAETVK
jgi:beta-RFAP synthase